MFINANDASVEGEASFSSRPPPSWLSSFLCGLSLSVHFAANLLTVCFHKQVS